MNYESTVSLADLLMAIPISLMVPTLGWLITTIMRFEKQLAEMRVEMDNQTLICNDRHQMYNDLNKLVHQMSRNIVRIGEHMDIELEK